MTAYRRWWARTGRCWREAGNSKPTVLRGTVQPRVGLRLLCPRWQLAYRGAGPGGPGSGPIGHETPPVAPTEAGTALPGSIIDHFFRSIGVDLMSNQVVGPRLLGAIALITLFAACSPQSSTAAADSRCRPGPHMVPAATVAPTPRPDRGRHVAACRTFADLVAQVGSAVVNVQVVQKSPSGQGPDDSEDDQDDPFNDFFRRFGLPRPNMPAAAQLRAGARHRLGLHHQSRRLHPHQHPRGELTRPRSP